MIITPGRCLESYASIFYAMDGFAMKHTLFFAVLILILGTSLNLLSGEIYQWVDKDGVQHFTDGPPPPGAEPVEGLSDAKPDEPRSKSAPAERQDEGAIEQGENGPTEGENAGPDGGDGGQSAYRDDYWRRKGWGKEPTPAEGRGPAEVGGNPPPPDQQDANAIEGGQNVPTEREGN